MRERFLVLDGLRGLAALAVFTFHMEGKPFWLMGQGHLAVDFFFMLSGFVLAHAYEERLGQPGGFGAFVRDRVIRLHPLLILSVIPGALLAPNIRDPFPALTFLAACIPFPAFWKVHLPLMGFPYNLPSWSLFWELFANLLFAVVAPRLSTRALIGVVGALLLVGLAASLRSRGFVQINITAGVRAFPCFALGVLLYRFHQAGPVKLPAWIGFFGAPLLLLPLTIPSFGPSGILNVIAVYGLFPLLILAGATRESRFPRICAFLGGLSYPLYILHFPITATIDTLSGGTLPPLTDLAIKVGVSFAAVILIWKLYDEPVRRWLRKRFGSRGHRQAEA